jgi:predicted PurR-regulated permease PerM
MAIQKRNMDNTTTKLPLYLKLSQIILGLLAFFFILYTGTDIIVPIIFATIIAILLNPFVNVLTRIKCNRVVAILIAVLLALLVIGSVTYFIVSQAAMFSETWPQFKQKFTSLFNDCINWFSTHLNVSKPKMDAWINKTKSEGMSNSSAVIGSVITTFGGMLVMLFLLPVYTFMILFYKPLLLEFIAQLFRNNEQTVVAEVLAETKTLIQSYLIGLLLEAAVVAALNAVGLLVLGVQYAILIGVIGALLNMIPYIGGLVAIALPMLMALATKSPITALWVFVLYIIVQFIDNNVIVPKIVASKVKINALVSIIVVLIGGALWGISGMFLAIPLTAIIKVIFDRIDQLKPFGFLLGDNQPQIGKFNLKKRKK